MNKTFGKILSEERTAQGLSQSKLAKLVNMPQCLISLYETNQRNPSLFSMLCLADTLGVSIDYLAGRTKNKEVNK